MTDQETVFAVDVVGSSKYCRKIREVVLAHLTDRAEAKFSWMELLVRQNRKTPSWYTIITETVGFLGDWIVKAPLVRSVSDSIRHPSDQVLTSGAKTVQLRNKKQGES